MNAPAADEAATERWVVDVGDCITVMRQLPDNCVDAIVTDPPYGMSQDPDIEEVLRHWLAGDRYEHGGGGFMGKTWDSFVPGPEYWRECFRVLKPGGYLLAFAAARTYDLMSIAIRFARFEVRDMVEWFYGTGFPKSLDVSKAIDKQRTEDLEPVRAICRLVRAAMDARGLKSHHLAESFNCHPRLIDHWAARDTDSQPNLPTWEQWIALKTLLGVGGEADAEVWRLNGRKGDPGDAWKAAPVVGEHEGEPGGFGDHRFSVSDKLIREPSDAAKRWAGWGTALKPGHEPIVLARKPLDGTVAANVAKWGTGALNIDACRIEGESTRRNNTAEMGYHGGNLAAAYSTGSDAGRWPANVILDEDAAVELDAQSGVRTSGKIEAHHERHTESTQNAYGKYATPSTVSYGDTGGASRFFYVAKASRAEREAGCDHLPQRTAGEATDHEDGSAGLNSPRAGAGRTSGARNHHPTVKPVALMRYLVRLVTPPGGSVLDPFCGSGTTGMAAVAEGFEFMGIEQDPEYAEIARARIAAYEAASKVFDGVTRDKSLSTSRRP